MKMAKIVFAYLMLHRSSFKPVSLSFEIFNLSLCIYLNVNFTADDFKVISPDLASMGV
jgi:hypothetical protein